MKWRVLLAKKEIAKEKMHQRSNLNKDSKKKYDHQIHKQLVEELSGYNSVALFASFGDEIEMYSLMDALIEKNYQVYLPKVEGKEMNFYPVHSKDELILSSIGILEPTKTEAVFKDDLDIIVVPMLAYDKDNFRVGYGGGYYDGYLKGYSGLKVGVAYSFQFTKESFVEAHDIACDFIVTERGKNEK